jgi:hypothetical protein
VADLAAPNDGGYLVPVKAWVREAEALIDGVAVTTTVFVGGR